MAHRVGVHISVGMKSVLTRLGRLAISCAWEHKFVVTQQRVHGGGLYRVTVGLWTTKPDLKGGKKAAT